MANLPKKKLVSRLNIDTAEREEIFNELAAFMINNKYRNSATREEVAQYFNITTNKATRLLKSFCSEKRVNADTNTEHLYWINLDHV